MRWFVTLTVIFVSGSAVAKGEKSLVEAPTKEILVNEVFRLKAIDRHHFNLQAPQECGESGRPEFDDLKTEARCQFKTAGEQRVTVSVCDDANTFCKQEVVTVTVEGLSTAGEFPGVRLSEAKPGTGSVKAQGFEELTFAEAQKRLASQPRSRVLLLVSTDWCPPCNELKEFLFPAPEFQSATKDYVKIYVDGDRSDRAGWPVRFLGYPTLILMNSNYEEISRKAGSFSVGQFLDWLREASEQWDLPIALVEQREKERRQNKLWRKVMDRTFSNPDSILKERLRLAAYYEASEKIEKVMEILATETAPAARNMYLNARMTLLNKRKANTPEESKALDAEKGALFKEVLEKDTEIEDYPSYVIGYCQIDAEDCRKYLKTAETLLDKNLKVPTRNVAERILLLGNTALYRAQLLEATGDSKKAKEVYKECAEHFTKLPQHSPLGVPRAPLQSLASCHTGAENLAESLKIYAQLAEAYPQENTFWSKQAQILQKQKRPAEALVKVDQALALSYGLNWLRTILLKAEIESQLGKKSAARATLKTALQKIRLPEDPEDIIHVYVARIKSRLQKL